MTVPVAERIESPGTLKYPQILLTTRKLFAYNYFTLKYQKIVYIFPLLELALIETLLFS